MKLRLFVAALVLGLVAAAAAFARGQALTGTFQSKIAKGAASGTWVIKLANPVFTTTKNGKLAVKGTYSAAEGTLTFIDQGGPLRCKGGSATGIFDYKLAGKKLTMKNLADGCKSRVAVMTAQPFTKIG